MGSYDIDALKAANDIVAVVSHYVPIKKRGAEYVGLCPFHNDHSPSFWVVPGKQIAHCFSCGANHDVISFVQEINGIDFRAACEMLGGQQEWTPRAPIQPAAKPLPERVTSKPPPDAPEPDMKLRQIGEPSRTWRYTDSDGALLGYVARYETPDGKQIRCWSWGARGDHAPGWGCGHWTKPRPLYGLQKLAERTDAPVLVVEGEKATDAAQALLANYSAITWPGGSNAWKHADWEPVRGRTLLLWPDNDQPGRECMAQLAAILADPRGLACKVRIIEPSDVPDGFDAADWTGSTDDLIAWAKPRARDYENPAPQRVSPSSSSPSGESERMPMPPEPAAGAGPDEMPPAEFPSDATLTEKPQRARKPRLSVVGNTALAPDEDAEPLPQSMSEDALADHFAAAHGAHWRYVKTWGAWFQWKGDGWHRDDTALVDRLAVQVTRQAIYWPDAQQLTVDAKRRLNSKRTAGNLRDVAMSDRRIAATVDQWDTDPWKLGVPGGVVDLRTGQLTDARPEDYITKRTAVAPEAGKCPHWSALISHATGGDDALIAYLQRLCGYILTGETREEMFAFIYGPAQTGKSTFLRVISEILGDYHRKATMETFTESRHERHAEELAVLVGARLVTSVETEEGKRWNESRIKALTGRDRIRARFMRENSFEFDPQFKLLIAGNHAPHLRNVDEAMRRRLHIIPFTRPIAMEERDDELSDKLRAEYPQILRWMIDGAINWQLNKLGRPEQIAQAVDNYLESEDVIGQWLSDCVETGPNNHCQSSAAYSAFKSWAESVGEYAPSQKRFVQALRERGFEPGRTGAKRFISGFSLRSSDDPGPSIHYSE